MLAQNHRHLYTASSFTQVSNMFKYVVLVALVAIASAAPAAEPQPDPHAAPHPAPLAAPHAAPHAAPVAAASAALHVEASSADAEPQQIGISASASGASASGPVPAAKQLLIAELPFAKTHASSAKLTPIAAPVLSPLAYAAPTILAPYPWSGLAAVPATYSIEQHGYHITY